jgi:hypothetical protein
MKSILLSDAERNFLSQRLEARAQLMSTMQMLDAELRGSIRLMIMQHGGDQLADWKTMPVDSNNPDRLEMVEKAAE